MIPSGQDTKTSYRVEYRAYHDAKQRCNNPKHKRYADWGGRGIEFRFKSFDEFFADVGERPNNCSIDRINNDGHYEVGNVKWSSRSTQQRNRRVSKRSSTGVTGVRRIKSKGVVSVLYQAYININGKFHQLYAGPDFNKACEMRKTYK